MRIALYSRPRPCTLSGELERLFAALSESGLSFQVNEAFARQIEAELPLRFTPDQVYLSAREMHPDTAVMVSYGGDGTFLEAVRILNNRSVPVIGINSGRLGFLANINRSDMARAFEEIKSGNYTLEERSLLYVEGDFLTAPDYPYAFNELTIQRQGASMIMTEVFVDGELIATCHGDGMLVSTPSGSTAYSLSVGGPVVSPQCNCLTISPIAPHNLTMRPVVVPDKSLITLKVHTREENFGVSLDNQNYSALDGAFFSVSRAEKAVFLVHLKNISFYETLRNKMMWGMDSRDVVR